MSGPTNKPRYRELVRRVWSSVLAPVGEISSSVPAPFVVVVGDGESSPGWPPVDPRDRHKERRDQGYRCSGGRGWLWGTVSRSSPRSPSTTWAGRLGQPFAAVAGVTAQPIEHGVHAQVALVGENSLGLLDDGPVGQCRLHLLAEHRGGWTVRNKIPIVATSASAWPSARAGLAQDRRDHDVSLIPAFFSTWTVSRSAEQGKRPTSRLGMFGCSGPKRVPLTACRNEPCAGFR
jgi:hypothetical protein